MGGNQRDKLRHSGGALVALMLLGGLAAPNAAAAAVVTDPDNCGSEPRYAEHTLKIPDNSPVRISRWILEGCYERTRFEGQFEISGRYEYTTSDEHVPGSAEDMELTFFPDDKDASRLPTWPRHASVGVIYVMNEEAFLTKVVGPRDIARVRSSRQGTISGRVTMIVTDYSVGGDCDHATHLVQFVDVVQNWRPQIASVGGSIGC